MSHDYLHSVSERPRQLTVYDLCLRFSDTDWHSPLLVRVNSHALKNKRTRGPDAQYSRKSTISLQATGTEQLARWLEPTRPTLRRKRRLVSTKPTLRRERRTIHFPIFIIELERTKMAWTTMGRLVWRTSLNRYNGSCTCLLKMWPSPKQRRLSFSGHCMLHGVLELSTCLNLCTTSTMN